MNEVLPIILRGVIAYFLLLIVSRFVGSKTISQMSFLDFTVAITFGSLTAHVGLGNDRTPLTGAILIVTFTVLSILMSAVILKSRKIRKLVDSEPAVVIAQGELVKANMKKSHLTIEMLNAMLREKDAFNITDVEYALFEHDGELSVLFKADKRPLTPSDMKVPKPYTGLTTECIIDGVLLQENLKNAGKDETWLLNELKNKGIASVKDVFFAALETDGTLYISLGISGREQHGKYGIE